MKKMPKPRTIAANPDAWSAESKQSVAFEHRLTKEYADIGYRCWRCGRPSIFTAEEQRCAYEVKKAYIAQTRILCAACWRESNDIAAQLEACEKRWKQSKKRTEA
ncbi:hypothetical protein E4K72_21105 [Oxalobacteraceae bacterium OM1]|nr:hypothetical protein E4K72_21105 [Oxalobacteraceae bacterium OM1]